MDTDDTVADQNIEAMANDSVPLRSLKRKHELLDNVSLAAVANEGRWDDVLAMIESATMDTVDLDAVIKRGRTALWLAAKEGHTAAVEALLQAGADANKVDDDGDAPLTVAASAPIAKMLIERGANANATNKLGQTALFCAACNSRSDVVEALLKTSVDVNKADKDGFAPLSVVASAPIATLLIEHGADVNAANRFGETALLTAADEGRTDVVEALLQAGADVNKADDDGDAPLTVAASAPIAAMLIERGADVNVANRRGVTALLIAAQEGDADVVEALLKAGADLNKVDEDDDAPLIVAASAPIAALLIERGANVNAANNLGDTALLIAGVMGRADVVEALVQAGADVNKADTDGRLPLTVAAEEGCWSFVALLARLSRHANVDALGSSGKTALWVALESDEAEAREAATALVCAGADVDFQREGVSLLRSAVQRWQSAENVLLLLAAGAAAVGVSAVDCCDRDVMALMMADGVVWTEIEIEQAIRRFGDDSDDDSDRDDSDDNRDERFMVILAEILSQVPAAKKRIEKFGFAAIRSRVLEICNAMQQLEIPAPQLIEIVTEACAPFAAQLPYHYLWDAVVLVKHYHSRAKK
jgi:ankyrin repeat protein